MKKSETSSHGDSLLKKYKELIVTTIICLFLTGIYDSINNQTAEIKKWYQLMIGINEKVKVQAHQLGRLEKSLDNHLRRTDDRFKDQGERIRTIEFEVLPYIIHKRPTQSTEDTIHAQNH